MIVAARADLLWELCALAGDVTKVAGLVVSATVVAGAPARGELSGQINESSACNESPFSQRPYNGRETLLY